MGWYYQSPLNFDLGLRRAWNFPVCFCQTLAMIMSQEIGVLIYKMTQGLANDGLRGWAVAVDSLYAHSGLHEVIFPVGGPVLVAAASHVLLGKDIIVGMILLPLLLLPLLSLSLLFLFLSDCTNSRLAAIACIAAWLGAKEEEPETNPFLLRYPLALVQLPLAIVLFLLEIGLLLHLGLVEAVDDGVLALGHENALDLDCL